MDCFHVKTYKAKGQRRYVHYFGLSLKNGGNPPHKNQCLLLEKMIVSPPPKGVGQITYKVLDRYKRELISYKDVSLVIDSINSKGWIWKIIQR